MFSQLPDNGDLSIFHVVYIYRFSAETVIILSLWANIRHHKKISCFPSPTDPLLRADPTYFFISYSRYIPGFLFPYFAIMIYHLIWEAHCLTMKNYNLSFHSICTGVRCSLCPLIHTHAITYTNTGNVHRTFYWLWLYINHTWIRKIQVLLPINGFFKYLKSSRVRKWTTHLAHANYRFF